MAINMSVKSWVKFDMKMCMVSALFLSVGLIHDLVVRVFGVGAYWIW